MVAESASWSSLGLDIFVYDWRYTIIQWEEGCHVGKKKEWKGGHNTLVQSFTIFNGVMS
jgi:hypothetical protein